MEKIYPIQEDEMWRIRINQELTTMFNWPNISSRKQIWIGQCNAKEVGGEKSKERPKYRWMDNVTWRNLEEETWKKMKNRKE